MKKTVATASKSDKPKVKRKGIVAKKGTSLNKNSKLYSKPYNKQGR